MRLAEQKIGSVTEVPPGSGRYVWEIRINGVRYRGRVPGKSTREGAEAYLASEAMSQVSIRIGAENPAAAALLGIRRLDLENEALRRRIRELESEVTMLRGREGRAPQFS